MSKYRQNLSTIRTSPLEQSTFVGSFHLFCHHQHPDWSNECSLRLGLPLGIGLMVRDRQDWKPFI